MPETPKLPWMDRPVQLFGFSVARGIVLIVLILLIIALGYGFYRRRF